MLTPSRRTRARRGPALLVALVLTLVIAGACSGDDAPGNASPPATASPTASTPEPATPTPTETPAPTATEDATPAAPPSAVALEEVATGLTAPLDLAAPDDGSGRLFVVEQHGVVRVVDADGALLETPLVDVRAALVGLREGFDERGLLGIALHPDFASNGRFYLYYSAPLRDGAPAGWNHTSHVSEFTVSPGDANVADPDSERIVMQIDQPAANHNAGHLRFGPDGYLYVPIGDGGGGGQPPGQGRAQDTTNWLGSVLRIDVDRAGDDGAAYAVPGDNPFVGEAGVLPEIWAYGLRNPFAISFDPAGEYGLFIADAGDTRFEWVNHARGGENFGWNIREGSHCLGADDCPTTGARGEPLVGPVVEYARSEFGTVIVGAELYRGGALPGLADRLVVADWSMGGGPSGGLLVAQPGDPGAMWEHQPLPIESELEGDVAGTIARYITGLARDVEGELYILTNESSGLAEGAGALYRLAPASMRQ